MSHQQSATDKARHMYGDRVWPPQRGYDLAAITYDSWHWQEFWTRNELPLVSSAASTFGHGGRILDVGCGTGTYLNAMGEAGAVGVDPSITMLWRARQKLPRHISVLAGRASDIPIRDKHFSVCLSTRSLAHEQSLTDAVIESARVLTPGGLWIVTEVHPRHEYPQTRIPVGDDEDVHIQTFKRAHEEIASAAMATGLWAVEFVREFRWGDLSWAPTSALFDRIDRTGVRPIFYIMVLRRAP